MTPPEVCPLDRLPVGQSGHIVSIAARDSTMLVRLANLGVAAGALVHLQQREPAVVLKAGETTVALEPAIAARIHVRPDP